MSKKPYIALDSPQEFRPIAEYFQREVFFKDTKMTLKHLPEYNHFVCFIETLNLIIGVRGDTYDQARHGALILIENCK